MIDDETGATDDGFDFNTKRKPNAFLQWKNTDVCMDFYCECGAHCHFDGYFAYAVKCPHCMTVWEMPTHMFPRKAGNKTSEHWRENPQLMEADEDHCDEIQRSDGAWELKAKAVR